MATVLAGPGAARYLADFGADVIKVERPGGDATRRMGWTQPGQSDSLFWKLVNRNKRSVVLDLKSEKGRARLLELVDDADVLVENMRPGKLESLSLGPEQLLGRNPRLVVVRVTGFGQTGPYAQRPGFATIAEALSGFSDLSGDPDGGPSLPPIALTDEVTALVGALVAMMALRHAERSGEGQVVDVSLLEAMLQIMGPLPAAYHALGYLQPRLGSGIPYTVPRGTYRCDDGVWVAVSASSDTVAERLLDIIGLGGDARFRDFPSRFANRVELERLTAAWIASRSHREVIETLETADAAVAKVNNIEDVVADPHLAERQALRLVDGVLQQDVVARFGLTPGRLESVGPPLPADDESPRWR